MSIIKYKLSSSFLSIVIAMLFVLNLAGCGQRKEAVEPLYGTEDIFLQNVNIEMWNNIGSTIVEPSTIRKITRTFFGWIPGVGDILELPINLVAALLPPLPSVSNPALPKDGEWNDPRVLNILKTIKLGAGFIRITPIEERGSDYKPEKCWFFWECDDVGFDDFLSGVSLFLLFKDLNVDGEAVTINDPPQKEILLASAETERDYDKNTRTMFFNVSDVNLRPYMDKYKNFEVKIIAKGGYPKHKVYLDGKLRLDLEVKLSKR